MIGLTSSLPEEASSFHKEKDLDKYFEFFYGDDVILKTMVRANPGIMLLKDGVVLAKWHHNDLPEYSEVKEEYMKE